MGNMWWITFFDLEKAYDTIWRYGIMKYLNDMDLGGRLALSVQNTLFRKEISSKSGDIPL